MAQIFAPELDDPRHAQLLAWAAAKIPHIGRPDKFGVAKAAGVISGDVNPRVLAVIVFHDYSEDYRTCQISAAAADPRWASRRIISSLLAISFLQYGCNKVYTAIPHKNERVIRFNEAIGFTREAVLKDQYGPGVHAVVCRMMARDYERRYLGERRKAA